MEHATTILVANTYREMSKLWGHRDVNREMCEHIQFHINNSFIDDTDYDGGVLMELKFGDIYILADVVIHGNLSFDIKRITRYYGDMSYDVTTEPMDVETLEMIVNSFLWIAIEAWGKDPHLMEEEREHGIRKLNEYLKGNDNG